MLGVALVYLGGTALLFGLVAGFFDRRRGLRALALGVTLLVAGFLLPAETHRVAAPETRLDQFAPTYQFNEFHRISVRAPCQTAYQAIKQVTAREITLFRTLTWLRRFGRPGPESILNAPDRMPLLDVATRTGFLELADEPDHEVVVGTVVVAPKGTVRPTSPEEYRVMSQPGIAKATMNFVLAPAGPDRCTVTTETRVHATDPSARRTFAAYWRVIYPGSALIRRMWLRAVRRRAERAA